MQGLRDKGLSVKSDVSDVAKVGSSPKCKFKLIIGGKSDE
jgi:hypothetical protein